ncbi:MAG: DegT/DnrJ/EryC1/StrS aminotransferase family protein [Clostridiales bacterium]|nr:DegT/DnrJ/EryC1/StrS aminotransferase family protein [Clostridiales bacterium]
MNVKKNIPFSPPDMSEAEVAEVGEALKSGWITTGPKTKEFEHLISMCCHTAQYDADGKPEHTTCCLNSATACMELALRVLGIGEGDEVIVPAYTYTATASSVCHVGARPVMVDCAPGSFEMDYDKLADAITEKTKAVMPVDLAGIVADYDKVYAAVESRKHLFRASNDLQKAYGRCIVIADAAHAFGAMWHGKMCGEIADFTSFSFHAVKNLTTAEGGALTWRSREGVDNEAIYKQLQLLSLHGQNKDALAKTKLGGWEYDIIGTWYKCNMTDIMAGIGLAQMKRYPEMLRRRRQLIERYNVALEPYNIEVLPHYGNDHCSSGHLYMVRLTGASLEQRNDVIVKMAERGIATNVHYKPLPMMTAYKAMGYDIKDYPNAYDQFQNEVTLPLHTRLSDDEVDYILSNFIDIIKEL